MKKGLKLCLFFVDDCKFLVVVEIGFIVFRNISMFVISVEFDKGYLCIDEYFFDVNCGFDLLFVFFIFVSFLFLDLMFKCGVVFN